MAEDKTLNKKDKKDAAFHFQGGLFSKINKRLFVVGVMPLFVIAAISFAFLYLSYWNSNTQFEETVVNLKRIETDRFVSQVVNGFQIILDPKVVGDANYLNPSQQVELIVNLMQVSKNTLDELSIIEPLNSKRPVRLGGDDIAPGFETSRCVKDLDASEGFRCSVFGHPEFNDYENVPLRSRTKDPEFLNELFKKEIFIGSVQWTEDDVPFVEFGAAIVKSASEVGSGNAVGFFIGRIRLTGLQDVFTASPLEGRISVFLADLNGRIMAHSDGVNFIGMDASKAIDPAKWQFEPNVKNEIIAVPIPSIRPLAVKEGRGFSAAAPMILDHNKLFVSDLITDENGIKLVPEANRFAYVVVEWPWQDAFLELGLLEALFLVVGLLLILIVRLVGIRLTKQIVMPIRTVQLGAERIGKGDFSQRVLLDTDDELEELGESLNVMSVELEKLEKVRSAETRARALATAVAKEEELKEEKDVLIATASHQFRTPVTALNWNIDLLRNMTLPDDAKGLLDGVAEHTKNLAMIASDLLNSTAFGAGYLATPDAEAVNLMTTFDEAIERFNKASVEKAVTFTKQYATTPVFVRGSFAALRIAFEQIVGNAIRYSNPNGVVTVVINNLEDGKASISVTDTGIGIPKNEQQFMFDAFFRAKNAIVMKNVGTGLGLYIANNIVTGHAGVINFNSTEGSGTTFTIVLPGTGVNPPSVTNGQVAQDTSKEE